MIDTLHIWIPESEIHMEKMWALIPPKISKATHLRKYNGFQSITGNLENIKVSISDRGLYLRGSLSKYINGNNIISLTSQFNPPTIK